MSPLDVMFNFFMSELQQPLAHEKRSRCLQATEFSHVGPESTNGGVDIDGHHSSKDQHSLNRAAVDNQYSPNHAST
ncbi:hypothetical protein BS78_05G242100 [Paspalum vaginatum]|nr:hypothetical protein BS78_05G242100 [Paspalum vaginatum]